MSLVVHVRNLRKGEQASLPSALLDTGMPYLDEQWTWVVEAAGPPRRGVGSAATGELDTPFALVVASFAHGWLVLWRLLAVSPLPPTAPLNWFTEAHPLIFAEARRRGCVGFLTLLADDRPEEVKLARIAVRLAGGTLIPFQGALGVGTLDIERDTANNGNKGESIR
jgi:hypothetical protein